MLRERDPREMPEDIGAIGERVLRADDPYRVIGERLADLVEDRQFAGLYQTTGRAAISPSLLALVTIFQFLEDLPDREAARQVVVRLDWKYALHLEVGDGGFDFSCLSYFRRRLLGHGASRLVFEAVLGRVRALGFLKKHGKQRTDALGVVGAVRELSQVELLWEAVRLAPRALLAGDAGWVETTVPAAYRERYLERRSEYRLSVEEREAELVRVGQDAAWLLDRLAADERADLAELTEVRTLAAIWEQRYERVEGRVRRRAVTVDSTELIVTPHDPGVRIGQKRGHAWWGDKVHITETVSEPDDDTAEPADQVRFSTDVTTAGASSGDGQALAEIREHLAERGLLPEEQVVDSGYVSGKHLAESAAAGVDLVGPPLADTSTNGFKLADFRIDREARCATCPAGQVSTKCAVRTERDGSRSLQFRFPTAVCAACPLRPQCTTSATGGRNLSISEHYERLVARRAEARTPAFRAKLRTRAGIEATLSELVRRHGLRRHRYRGDAKRHVEHLLTAAACNLKRLARALAVHTPTPHQPVFAAAPA